MLYHYTFLAPPAPELRQELNALSLEQLLERARANGLTTNGIDTRNKRRVIRLIENDGQLPTKQDLRPNTLILGLHVPREQLHDRVVQRVDTMLTAGLEFEAKQLASEYGWDAEPMKGIGYAQWQAYVTGTHSLEDTRAKIIKATQELAKRQRTWFKRNSSIQWLETPVKWMAVDELITTFLSQKSS